MELIRGLHNLRSEHRGCVLTIGKFDGVHLGHRELLLRLVAHGQRLGLPATVMSFEPSPGEYFGRGEQPPRIATLRDNMAALATLGVQRLVMVRFDGWLAAMSPGGFVDEVLCGRLGIAAIVIGDDFRYGHNRGGGRQQLQEYGRRRAFVVDSCSSVAVDGERVSSTSIRAALAAADLRRAEALLGRRYPISGMVRHGLKLGRKLGMPTANIGLRRPMALRQGVYAVQAHCDGQSWPGVANLGVRPTLGMSRCLLETHLFGEPGSLYGRVLKVEFRAFMRPERKFPSLDALSDQMRADADAARALLATLSQLEST